MPEALSTEQQSWVYTAERWLMSINKELLKGNSATLVLKLLARRDMYGYQLAQEIAAASQGAFSLTEGTLYPVLHSLEADGNLECYWEEEGGRKRKYYKITKVGRALLKQKTAEWESFRSALDLVLGGAKLGAL
jgi:PadR family transcriptional regulator PadR